MKFLFLCLFLFCAPVFSHAAVVINEVAWMGTDVSANDEWIELYNNGTSAISLDGWTLRDGVSLEIDLSAPGSIAAGEYAVLERTDDASAPGTAFLIYTGALSNIGATLSLYQSNESLEDRIVGGEDWQNIGGDNITKETAQHTSSGWVTAVATPGAVNHGGTSAEEEDDDVDGEEEGSDEEEDDDGGDTKSNSSSVGTLYTTPRELQLELNVPRRAYVNQEVSLNAEATGLSSAILHSLTHSWNFGDFTIGAGESIEHRYEYPGEYVVTLHSQYKEYEAYARQTVTVLPVSFSLTSNSAGDIQVHNDSKYEVDVSGYNIQAGKTLRFPEGTILLPNATITIPKKKLRHTRGKIVVLKDEMSTLVATLGTVDATPRVITSTQPLALSTFIPPAPKKVAAETVAAVEPSENFSFAGDKSRKGTLVPETELDAIEEDISPSTGSTLLAAPIQAADTIPSEKLPYFALLGVIGLGVLSVFAGKIKK